MKTYKLNLHSFIDIITNSSTEIYTYPGRKSVDTAYDMIQKLFDNAGIDLKSRDCYDIYIARNIDEDYDECDPYRIDEDKYEEIIEDCEYNPGLCLIAKSKSTGEEIDLQELSSGIFETGEFGC